MQCNCQLVYSRVNKLLTLGILVYTYVIATSLYTRWVSITLLLLFLIGRGVLLTTTYHGSRTTTRDTTSYFLCITYKAALSAGFDWLEYTGVAGENYIKAAVGSEGIVY